MRNHPGAVGHGAIENVCVFFFNFCYPCFEGSSQNCLMLIRVTKGSMSFIGIRLLLFTHIHSTPTFLSFFVIVANILKGR